ncbi:MAG: hypothetical protein LDL31_10850 [Prosthecobacter sp.]|nr:hypothetical protein [Prosthecobacter sp.]
MSLHRIWTLAGLLLAAIWTCVAIVMHQTDDLVSWPGKVQARLEQAPWLKGEKLSDEARRSYLAIVIRDYQRLDNAQRRSLREDAQESLDAFFASLTDEEKKMYVDRTIEPLFETIEKGLKVMPIEERKRLIGRMRGDLKNLRGSNAEGDRLAEQDRKFMEDLMADDPMLFLRGASITQKLELAPVLEDMQSRVQGLRR